MAHPKNDERFIDTQQITGIGVIYPDDNITDHADSGQEGSIAWVLSNSDRFNNRGGTIELVRDHTYYINQDLTIPSDIEIRFQRDAIIDSELVSLLNSDYSWVSSDSTSSSTAYYLLTSGASNPNVNKPGHVFEDGSKMTKGDASTGLSTGEWDYGDWDGLGFNTVYVRLTTDDDPDTHVNGYIEKSFILTINGNIKSGPFQIFGSNLGVVDNISQDLSSISGQYTGEIRINDGTTGSMGPYWWDGTNWNKMDDWSSTITP